MLNKVCTAKREAIFICEENVITQNAVKTSMNLAKMQYEIDYCLLLELSTVSLLMTDIKIIHK